MLLGHVLRHDEVQITLDVVQRVCRAAKNAEQEDDLAPEEQATLDRVAREIDLQRQILSYYLAFHEGVCRAAGKLFDAPTHFTNTPQEGTT